MIDMDKIHGMECEPRQYPSSNDLLSRLAKASENLELARLGVTLAELEEDLNK